ncbi:hypothetical protein EZV62_001250 [Acer yangbiense]|uniref:F-box associated beta-propeller type 3 domain-containing protein n=1 Tax=Acer yangbiense TaxID=1000413 RepID=A0A5C7ITQ7_9ROSI|nr:hypothetical protein EZV62_001250 [Acer yangbiense]
MHFSQTQRQKLLLIGEVLSSVDLQTALDGKVVLDDFDYPLEEKPDSNWISVYNSFNGLFCISPKYGVCFVYNPSTRESKKIPDSKPIHRERREEILSGFGYVESIDDYKLMKVVMENTVHVFSLRNNSWKIVQVDFPFTLFAGSCTNIIGICLNGAIHWMRNELEGPVIAAFDLVEDKFRLLSLPDSINYKTLCY